MTQEVSDPLARPSEGIAVRSSKPRCRRCGKFVSTRSASAAHIHKLPPLCREHASEQEQIDAVIEASEWHLEQTRPVTAKCP